MHKPLLIGLAGRPGSGRNTIANYIALKHDFIKVSIEAPIKELVRTLFHHSYKHLDQVKEVVDPCFDISPQNITQAIKQSLQDHIDYNLWVVAAQRRARSIMTRGVSVVITDVKSNNEACMIRDNGGEMWHVVRPEVKQLRKPGDGVVTPRNDDKIVANTTTIGDLYQRVNLLCKALMDRNRI